MTGPTGLAVCRTRSLLVPLLVALVLAPSLLGAADLKSIAALPINDPIHLDGVLDEAVWAQAQVGSDFVQWEPENGQPATERTEIRVVYTPRTLYIAIRALDREPEKIIAKEMQRDAALWRDDDVQVLIDTFDDNRNAYMFEVNPNGARTDALITDEGRNFTTEWDGVWDVAARTDSEGWVAEIEIPFSTLRFDPRAASWGLNVHRYIRRKGEDVYWSPVPLDADIKRVSLYGELTGLKGIEQGWNLNIKPFVVGTLSSTVIPDAEDEDDSDIDLGFDVKWGVTRNLNLDLTMNTDFGETEVDEQQVNLTRFSLFFPEKREFFLENAGIFEFGPGDTGGGAPLLKLFFSRRIGIQEGQEVPIDWGTRLTGRVGEWNIGLLDVTTDAELLEGHAQETPSDNWGAVRVSRNIGKRSSVGMIYTNRSNSDNTNNAYGVDLDFNATEHLGFDAYLAGTENTDVGPEDDWSAGLGATWTGPVWDWNAGWVRVGEEFDPQMGFLLRRGVYRYNAGTSFEPRPATPWIRNLNFGIAGEVFTDLDGEVETEVYDVDVFGLRTESLDELTFFTQRTYEHLSEPFVLTPEVVIDPGEYTFTSYGLRFLTHSSRPVAVEGEIATGDFYDGTRDKAALLLQLRPNRYLRFETSYEINDIELPVGDLKPQIVRQRLAVAMTPRLLANMFIQYNDLAEVLSLNFRFNWIYRPGADLFVVFNQTWDAPSLSSLTRRDRQFIIKYTYLFQH